MVQNSTAARRIMENMPDLESALCYNVNYLHFKAPNSIIVLTFITFDMEDAGCNFDYLEIRDGDSAYSPMLGMLCGDEDDIPDHVVSTSNSILLRCFTF